MWMAAWAVWAASVVPSVPSVAWAEDERVGRSPRNRIRAGIPMGPMNHSKRHWGLPTPDRHHCRRHWTLRCILYWSCTGVDGGRCWCTERSCPVATAAVGTAAGWTAAQGARAEVEVDAVEAVEAAAPTEARVETAEAERPLAAHLRKRSDMHMRE